MEGPAAGCVLRVESTVRGVQTEREEGEGEVEQEGGVDMVKRDDGHEWKNSG